MKQPCRCGALDCKRCRPDTYDHPITDGDDWLCATCGEELDLCRCESAAERAMEHADYLRDSRRDEEMLASMED